jgi:hypothetical protein
MCLFFLFALLNHLHNFVSIYLSIIANTLGEFGTNGLVYGVSGLVFEQHEEFRHRFCATNAFFTLPQGGSSLQRGLLVS